MANRIYAGQSWWLEGDRSRIECLYRKQARACPTRFIIVTAEDEEEGDKMPRTGDGWTGYHHTPPTANRTISPPPHNVSYCRPLPCGLLSNLICRGFIIDCSGLKTNGKHINESGSELRDYGLARSISTPGDTHRLTHEKSEAAGAAQSNPPFGRNPL